MSQQIENTFLASNDEDNSLFSEMGFPINPETIAASPSNDSGLCVSPIENFNDNSDNEDIGAPNLDKIEKSPPKIIRKFIICTAKTNKNECNKHFSELFEFQKHQMYVHKIKPYSCQQCGERFENHGEVGSHRKEMHSKEETESYTCTKKKCADKPKSFNEYNLLYQHDYLYHRKGRFECNMSNCKFKPFYADYYSKVKNHQRKERYHQEKNFECPEEDCYKKFNTPQHLSFHMLLHAPVVNDN